MSISINIGIVIFTISVILQTGNCQIVCDIGYEICDYECYNPSELQCVESGMIKIVCPMGMDACGEVCYSPGPDQVCHQQNGLSAVCRQDEVQCGDQCFYPPTQRCFDDGIVCGVDEELCGGKRCYRPSPKTQCTSQGRICPEGEESCGHHCYMPSPDKTCHFDRILCHDRRKICGHECYSEEAGQTCINDSAVCLTGQVLCGKYDCYDPNDQTSKCFTQEGSNIGRICGANEDVCEGKCYDPTSFECFPYQGLGKTCPIGSVGCGGTDCYEPNGDQVCLTNFNREEQLCNSGQSLCGSICYNPEANFKCFSFRNEGYDVLCKSNEEVCGETCFNPKTQTCHPGK